MPGFTAAGPSRRQWLRGACFAVGLAAVSPVAWAIDGVQGSGQADHAVWDGILKSYVTTDETGLNRVAYARLKAEARDRIDGYIASLAAAAPSRMSRRAAMAYWINLYNALTVDVVVDHYPVSSIREIDLSGWRPGPWREKLVTVEGRALSLDDIEHDILRAEFGDPLVHYAVNCASLSCPNLMKDAYTAVNLDVLMEENARDYVNSRYGLDLSASRPAASKIYRWYGGDFGGVAGLLDHWRAFASPELLVQFDAGIRPERYAYDWSLNDAR